MTPTFDTNPTLEEVTAHKSAMFYGSVRNKEAYDELYEADKDSRREYIALMAVHDNEEGIIENMNGPLPYFMDPMFLRALPLHLIGAPNRSPVYSQVMFSKADLRAKRHPRTPCGTAFSPRFVDYTEMGWPSDQGDPKRAVSPEEHEEIVRRLGSGSLTKPGSEVALKRQTLASLMEEDTQPPPWIIEGLLRAGGALLVYGPSGIGKSWFVHTLILMATHGRSVGIRDPETNEWVLKAGEHQPIKVGLFDGEMIKEDISDRSRILCGALGVKPASASDGASPIDVDQLRLAMVKGGSRPEDIKLATVIHEDSKDPERTLAHAVGHIDRIDLSKIDMHLKTDQHAKVVFPDLADPEWKARVIHYVRENGIKVLVCDNLSTLSPTIKDENAAAEWTPLNDLVVALKHEGVATVLVHHSGKGGDYRGSSNILATMETSVRLGAVESGDIACHDARFKVDVQKHRSHGTPPVNGKVLRLSDGKWRVEIDEQGAMERAARLLRTCRYTKQTELGAALGVKQGTISKLLKEADATGVITKAEVISLYRKAKELRADLTSPFDDGEELEVTLDI